MKKIVLFIIFHFLIGLSLTAQKNDTCQCELIEGNYEYATIRTYHHDSLLTIIDGRIIRDSLFSFLRASKSIDYFLNPINYKFGRIKQYLVTKEGITQKFIKENLLVLPNKKMNKFDSLIVFYLGKESGFNDSFLFAEKFKFEEQEKVNGIMCNCFNSNKFRYKGVYKSIDLISTNLSKIGFAESWNDSITNQFVWVDGCSFGSGKICYLKGIGDISTDFPNQEPYNISYKFLRGDCNKYLKDKFNIELKNK